MSRTVQLLLLLFFSASPITGHPKPPSLPEAIQLFQMEMMNQMMQTMRDQEGVISEQQVKIAKLEDENAGCQELERMRSRLQQCESTVLYMVNLMVQNNEDTVEAELGTIDEVHSVTGKEEINGRWNGSLTDLDIKKLYIDVMNEMKTKFQSGVLNMEQIAATNEVTVETQSLLGRKSLEVLGLRIGDKNSVQTFEVLKGWEVAGNMTAEQDSAMQVLAEDSQIRMIQGLLGVFGYTAEQAALSYNVSAEDVKFLLQLPTFGTELESNFERVDSTTNSGTEDSG